MLYRSGQLSHDLDRLVAHTRAAEMQDARKAGVMKMSSVLEAMAMIRLLLQWVLSALSLMMVAKLLPGFHIKDFGSALGVAAVYGILHVVLYPLLLFVAFIPVLLSFGLFIFVINAFLLFLTSALLDNFHIDNIPTALLGAVSLTILNGIWRWLLF